MAKLKKLTCCKRELGNKGLVIAGIGASVDLVLIGS